MACSPEYILEVKHHGRVFEIHVFSAIALKVAISEVVDRDYDDVRLFAGVDFLGSFTFH